MSGIHEGRRMDPFARSVVVVVAEQFAFEMYDPKNDLPDVLEVTTVHSVVRQVPLGRGESHMDVTVEGETEDGRAVTVERRRRNGDWHYAVTVREGRGKDGACPRRSSLDIPR